MTTYADLQQAMRGKVCVLCSSEPRIAYLEGELKLRCNCWPKAPVLGKRPKSELVSRRILIKTLIPADEACQHPLW